MANKYFFEEEKKMSKQKKYPDTEWFHCYNANPFGKRTSDCVVRAVSVFLNQSYEKTIREMAEMQIRTGISMFDKEGIEAYLKEKGILKQKQPKKFSDNKKYEGWEFCNWIAKKNKRYLCNIGCHHVVAIVGCKIWDTWDSSDGCIGNYWEISE